MTNFTIDYDASSGILTCRIHGFLSDEEGANFARAMLDARTRTRRTAPSLRLLFDNKQGNVFSSAALQSLNAALKGGRMENDRTAVLVANQVNLMQARRNMGEGSQVFLSEDEALAWLRE